MTFKEARKEARKIAIKNSYWGYIIKDKDKNNYYVSEEDISTIKPEDIFYVDKSGKILKKINYLLAKQGLEHKGMYSGIYPFSPNVMNQISIYKTW